MNEIKYDRIIQRIVDTSQEQLTDWEVEFISSVYDWHIFNNKKLSDKQKKIILKINARLLGRSDYE